eukprot:gene9505-8947_t
MTSGLAPLLLCLALLAITAQVNGRVSSPAPRPPSWSPRPPSPVTVQGVFRSKFRCYTKLNNGLGFRNFNTTQLNADMIIAVSRAFAIPEINGPFDIPAGVVIFDSRAIDSSDVGGNAQVDETFLGGITIEFDTSYPTSFILPLSINPVTTWPGPIFSGMTEIASLNATFSSFTRFFFTKYSINTFVGSSLLNSTDIADLLPAAPYDPPPFVDSPPPAVPEADTCTVPTGYLCNNDTTTSAACVVSCAVGYTRKAGLSESDLSGSGACPAGGTVDWTIPAGNCVVNTCTVPTGYLCNTDSAASAACVVSCAVGYTIKFDLSGSDLSISGTCLVEGTDWTIPPGNCVDTCTLPSPLDSTIVGGDDDACSDGLALQDDETCNVQCATGYTPDIGSTTTYTCNADGTTLTPPTLICTDICTLPSPLDSTIVGGDDDACSDGLALQNADSCNVQCATGYTPDGGSTTYTCSLEGTTLTPPALICTDICTLPSTLGNNIVAGDDDACSGDLVLGNDDSCNVQCATGTATDGGSTTYTCNADGSELTPPTLTCTDICELPSTLGSNIVGGDVDACSDGLALADGATCNVQCATGSTTDGGSTTYTCNNAGTRLTQATLSCTDICTLPSTLGSNIVAGDDDACSGDLVLGNDDSCNVQCAPGSATDGGSTTYTCNADGSELTPPTLTCTDICTLPSTLDSTYVGGATDACSDGLALADGITCNVQCATGYEPAAGSLTDGTDSIFTCNADGSELTPPTLTCTDICELPSTLGSNIVGGDVDACSDGLALADGATCNVQCATGYVTDGGSTTYTCNLAGTDLTQATLTCTDICILPSTLGSNIVAGDDDACSGDLVLGNDDSCNVQCAPGSATDGGSTTYTCNADGSELTPPTLTCTDICTLPSTLDSTYVGGATDACSDGLALADGITCNVQCATGYEPAVGSPTDGTDSIYTCNADGSELTPPTLTCTDICELPSTLGSNIVGGDVDACSDGLALADGATCNVQCATGYVTDGGSTTYTCNLAGTDLTQATLTCTDICTLPSTLGSNIVAGDDDACSGDLVLGNDDSCNVQCAPGSATDGGSTTYTCNADGSELTPPTLTCTDICELPSTLGSNIVGGDVDACSDGLALADGATCNVQCATGSTTDGGSTTYTCNNAGTRLTQATLSCTDICTLPSTLDSTYVGGATDACSDGLALADGITCNVQCATGYEPAAGSLTDGTDSIFTCNADGSELTPPTLTCTDICELPSTLGSNIVGGDVDACSDGLALADGATCNVQCATGYVTDGGSTTYTCNLAGTDLTQATLTCTDICTLPSTLGSNIVAGDDDACSGDLVLGNDDSCNVQCAPGSATDGGSTTYTCNADGSELTPPTLTCTDICTLPSTLDSTYVGGATDACSDGLALADGITCNVQCATGYEPAVGSPTDGTDSIYTCNADGSELTPPTLTCTDTCTLPSTLGTNIVGGDNDACSGGFVLDDDESCNVQCDTGYTPDSGSITTYSCSADGTTLTPPSLTCTANTCTVPTGYLCNTDSAASAACVVSCAVGYTIKFDLSGSDLSTSGTCLAEGTDWTIPPGNCVDICTLPSTLDNNIVAGDVDACNADMVLPDGDSCNVKCDTGYTPNSGSITTYTCSVDGTTLTPPSLTCTDICQLPSPLGSNIIGGDVDACTDGQALGDGITCNVKCAAGSTTDGGSTTYTCNNAGTRLTPPSLTCTDICTLPSPLGSNFIGGATDACSDGLALGNDITCNVQCAPGYESDSGTTIYTCNANGDNLAPPTLTCTDICTLPSPLGSNFIGGATDACSDGLALGNDITCNVQCAPGYEPDSGTTKYTCNADGDDLDPPTLTCTDICTLPSTLDNNIVAGDVDACNADMVLPDGDSCNVKCDTGYTPNSGSITTYTCSVDGTTLTPPSLTCTDICQLPSPLGSNIIGGDVDACTDGQALGDGITCNVKCAAGSTTDGGSTTYTCNNAGTRLTPPSLTCTDICTLPSPLGSNFIGGATAACSDGLALANDITCNVQCAPGYESDGGTTIYTCNADGDDLDPPKLICTDICELPSPLGSNIVGGDVDACSDGLALADGATCNVQCATGYVTDGGSTTYTCNLAGTDLTEASLTCTDICQLPSPLGSNIVGGATAACSDGLALTDGATCNVRCATGYTPAEGSPDDGSDSIYTCNADGSELTPPTLTCT